MAADQASRLWRFAEVLVLACRRSQGILKNDKAKVGSSGRESYAPSLLLVDFLMPGMSGAEVATKARLLRPALPVIFITGYSDTTALAKVARAQVLKKPFDVDQLAALIKAA